MLQRIGPGSAGKGPALAQESRVRSSQASAAVLVSSLSLLCWALGTCVRSSWDGHAFLENESSMAGGQLVFLQDRWQTGALGRQGGLGGLMTRGQHAFFYLRQLPGHLDYRRVPGTLPSHFYHASCLVLLPSFLQGFQA